MRFLGFQPFLGYRLERIAPVADPGSFLDAFLLTRVDAIRNLLVDPVALFTGLL